MSYSTYHYVYDMASSIHGFSWHASRAFAHNDPLYYEYLPNTVTHIDDWYPAFQWSRAIFWLFDTRDFTPTDEAITKELRLFYNLLPSVNGGSPFGRDSFVAEWFPKFKEGVNNEKYYFRGTSSEILILNNILRMYRQLPLWVSVEEMVEYLKSTEGIIYGSSGQFS